MKLQIVLGMALGAIMSVSSGYAAEIQTSAGPVAASIDRFSDQSGHLFRRSAMPGLPKANEAINLDQGPFITKGLGPDGSPVSYYNLDVMPTTPAPIYVLFAEGAAAPLDGQFNIVNVIPGESGYSDFWNVVKVTVPATYKANQITSLDGLMAAGFKMENTTILVNCPVVPEGSTATLRYQGSADTGLHQGWYKGMRVSYFHFAERDLALTSRGEVPLSPIFVTFNKNPDMKDATSGPASGFRGRQHRPHAQRDRHHSGE